MNLLNDTFYTVVKEYIVFLKDEVVSVFFDENELRAIGNRTNCQVELTNRILNRKIGGYKIVKYAIIQIKGKDDLSVRQCNKLLEQRCPLYRQRQEYNKKKYCCTLFPEDSTPDNASLYFQYQRSGSTTFQFGNILLKSPYESTIKRSMENCYWKTNDNDLRRTVVMPSTKQTENYFSRYFKGSVTEQECFDHKSYSCCIFSNPISGDQINQAYDKCKSGKFSDYPKQKEQFIFEEILDASPPEESKFNKKNDEVNKITRLSKSNSMKKHAIDYSPQSKIHLETIDKINNTDKYPTKLHSFNDQVGDKSSMKITKQEPSAKMAKITNKITESNAAVGQISTQNDLKINDKFSEPLQNAAISNNHEELRTSLFDLELENYSPVVKEQKSSSDKDKSSINNLETTQYSSQFKITTEHGEINLNISGSRSRDTSTDVDNKSLANRDISVKIDVFEDNYLIPGTFDNSTNFSKMEGELRSSLHDVDEERHSHTTGKNVTIKGMSTSSPKNEYYFSEKANNKHPVEVHSLNIDISKQNNLQTNMAHNQYQTNEMFISTDTHIGPDKDFYDHNKMSHSMTLQVTTDSQKHEISSADKTETENTNKNSKLITFELENVNYNDERPSAIEIKFGIESFKDVNEVNNLNLQEFSVANKYDQIQYKIANDAKESHQINLSENQEHFQSPEMVSDANLNQQKSYSPTAEFTTKFILTTDENMLQKQSDKEIQIQTSETKIQNFENFDNEIAFMINQFLDTNDKCVAIQTISTTKEMFILDNSDRKSLLEKIEQIKETSKCKTVFHESTIYHPTTKLNDNSINKTSFSNKFSTNQEQEQTFDNYNFHQDNINPFDNMNKYSKSNESKSTKITTPTLSSIIDIEDSNYSKQKLVSADKSIKQEDVRLLLKLPLNIHNNRTNEISENFQETNREFQIVHPDNPSGAQQKLHTFRVITNTDSYQFNTKIESSEKSSNKPLSKSESLGVHSDNKYLANFDILSDSTDINISTSLFKFNANVKENENQSIQFQMTIRNNYKQYANELPITKVEADIPSPVVECHQDNFEGNILKYQTNRESDISAPSLLPYETKTSAICTTEIFQSPADILSKSTNQKHSFSKNLASCFPFTKEKKETDKHKKLKNKHKTEIDQPKSKIGDCLQLPRRKSLSKISEINMEKIQNTNENGVEQELLKFRSIQFEEKQKIKDSLMFKRGSTLDKDSEEIFNDNSTNESLINSKKSDEILIHVDTSLNESSIQEIVSEINEIQITPKSEVLLQTNSIVNSSLVFDKDLEEDNIHFDSSPIKTVIIPETEIKLYEKRKTRETKTAQQKLISCNEDSGDASVCCETSSDSSNGQEMENTNLKTKLLEIENNPQNLNIIKSLFKNTSFKNFAYNKISSDVAACENFRRNMEDNQAKFEETLNILPIQGIYESIFSKSSVKDSSDEIIYCDTSTNASDLQLNLTNDIYVNVQIPEAEIQPKTTETSNSLFLNTFDKDSEDDNIYFDPSTNVNGVHENLKNGINSKIKLFKNDNKSRARETLNSIFIDSIENGSDNSSNSVLISDISNNAHNPVVSYQKEWRKQNRDNPALATLTKLENLSGMDLLVQQMSEKIMIDISCLNETANYPEIQPIDSESQSSETLFSLKFEIPIETNLFVDKANNNFINGNNFDLFQESISSEISSLTKIPESNFEIDKYLLDDICSMSSDSILNSNFSNSTEYFPEFLSKYLNEFSFSPDLRHIDLFPLIDSDELKEYYSDLKFAKLFNENLFCPSSDLPNMHNSEKNSKDFNEKTDSNCSQKYAIDKIYQSEILNQTVEICKLNKLINTSSRNILHVSSTNIIYKHSDWPTFIDRFYLPHLKLAIKIIANDLQRIKNMKATKINYINQEKSQILPNFSNEFVCKNYKSTNNIPKFRLNDNCKVSKTRKSNSTNNCKFNEWSKMEFGKISDQNATIDCKMINEIRIKDEINSSNDCTKVNNLVSHSTDKDNMADSPQHQKLSVNNENDNFDRIKNWIQQNSEYSYS